MAVQRTGARPRLVDVAKRARVAKGTASRILNGDGTLVSRPETRQRVLAAAEELGYRPHPVARALARSSAQVIALLAPSLGNPAFAPLVRAAQRRAQQLGCVLLTSEDPDNQLADKAFVHLVEEGRIDGLIIASARPDHQVVELLEKSRLPHVFVYREVATSQSNVHLDIRKPAVLAASYLLSLGHRRMAHVAGPAGNRLWAEHSRAFVAAVRKSGGITVARPAIFTEAGGSEAAHHLLRRDPDLSAVYASSLLQTAGVLAALRELGKAVPEDVSVLAYDELPLAAYLSPPVTTVAVPIERLGTAAVDAVMERFKGAEPRNVMVDCPPQIVPRSSTAPRK